jgi:endoglucanase Acf2
MSYCDSDYGKILTFSEILFQNQQLYPLTYNSEYKKVKIMETELFRQREKSIYSNNYIPNDVHVSGRVIITPQSISYLN